MTSPVQCWPFVVATKPPAGYCDVLTPAYLDGIELRGLIGAEAGTPTAVDPVAQRVLLMEEPAWLVFQVAHRPPAGLPPRGDGRRSSSSRDVVVVWGCVVRSDGRPPPAILRMATASAIHDLCEDAFDRFWAARSNAGWPAHSSALDGHGQPVPPALPLPELPVPAPPIPAPPMPPPDPGPAVPAPARTDGRPSRARALVVAAALVLIAAAVAVTVVLLVTTR